jgi:mRNA interferase MazF
VPCSISCASLRTKTESKQPIEIALMNKARLLRQLICGPAASAKLSRPICVPVSAPSRIGNAPKLPSTMKTRRGDVVLVLFPNSDLRTAKRRPAVVVQRENLATALDQTIVAMISSNPARADHPSRIAIPLASPTGKASGLRLDSWLMTDNLATVLDSQIDSVLGRFAEHARSRGGLKHTLAME